MLTQFTGQQKFISEIQSAMTRIFLLVFPIVYCGLNYSAAVLHRI
jgi:hypothetical protein